MSEVFHRNRSELEHGTEFIRNSPRDAGLLEMIARRPAVLEREVIAVGMLDLVVGLIGDNWRIKGCSRSKDGAAHPDMQLNIMDARAIALFAQSRDRSTMSRSTCRILKTANRKKSASMGGCVLSCTRSSLSQVS